MLLVLQHVFFVFSVTSFSDMNMAITKSFSAQEL